MKDIYIKSKRIKVELITFAICVLLGVLANVGAIFYYETSFVEFYTSFLYVFCFSIFLYISWSILRVLVNLIVRILKSKTKIIKQ